MITEDQAKQFHCEYLRLTGLDIPLTTTQRFRLERFIFDGGNEADLALVVAYLKRRIRTGHRQRESLLPRNIFADYSNFAEDLSMARAESRQPKVNKAKQSVLSATGRSMIVEDTVKSAAQILSDAKALAGLRQWRKESGL
jgi:hypothetical protein